jgi:uncharacterized protein (DUF1800 family)
MRSHRIPVFAVLLLFAGASSAGTGSLTAADQLTERQRAIHVLNRLGFGGRPGDVDRVVAIGVGRWIDQQLHPDRIRDEAMETRLARFQTLKMSSQEIFDTFARPELEIRTKLKQAKKDEDKDAEQMAKEMRAAIPPDKRPRRVLQELTAQRVLRAVYSERQLNEVMVDFWMNHFNVAANKGFDRVFLTSYERDVIRPHIWGKFSDLLMATAESPAMLFYLDNARSVADEAHRAARAAGGARMGGFRGGAGSRFGGRRRGGIAGGFGGAIRMPPRPAGQNAKAGLNENYARELMELHTLGVDGGYTQKDVTELARILTGWSIRTPKEGSVGFVFRANLHDIGDKTFLGTHFPAGRGMDEGERAILLLAHHPATAHHIAFELCQRLVADNPPVALVDRVAKRFTATDGDLRETVRAVIESPEFFDPQFYRAKVKSPFDYVVSAVRALNGETDGRMPALQIAQMGEPLYLCQPPTGYSNKAETWVSSGSLVTRLNFALALANGNLAGTNGRFDDLPGAKGDADEMVNSLTSYLVGEVSESTRTTIAKRIESSGSAIPPEKRTTLVTALLLGSPEFQRQ